MDTVLNTNVKDIVQYTAGTDARETVIDGKTGAKIRINIDGVDEDPQWGTQEPFYIEHGDNLYDAYNRKEAVMILSNIRKGDKFPDQPSSTGLRKPAKRSKPRTTRNKASNQISLRKKGKCLSLLMENTVSGQSGNTSRVDSWGTAICFTFLVLGIWKHCLL
jgi:hypothetical protein